MIEVIELLDEQIKTGEPFPSILYEFHYGRFDCELVIKRCGKDRPFSADLGVRIPDTCRMYSCGIAREPSLEKMKQALLSEKVQGTIFPYIKMLIDRLSKGD